MVGGNRMTNYEKIKSMTIEEMAEFFTHFESEDYCNYCEQANDFCCGILCDTAVAEWLNEEVTE